MVCNGVLTLSQAKIAAQKPGAPNPKSFKVFKRFVIGNVWFGTGIKN